MNLGRDLPLFFARCTMEARRAMFHARREVIEIGGNAISPEHLLLGLMQEDVRASWTSGTSNPGAKIQSDHILLGILADGGTPAADLLHSMGVTSDGIRSQMLAGDPDEDEA
jgi:hypothetical protein